MLTQFAAIIGGFILLVWGANRFVNGAAATARNLGVSPLIIGLTIVGFGTSAPEILVSAVAAWQGNPGLAIGNAIGSNITNIALVLGATAVVATLDVHSSVLRREMPVLLGAMLAVLVLLWDGSLDRLDGIVLLSAMGLMILWLTRIGLRSRSDSMGSEYADEIPTDMSTPMAVTWLAIGLLVLLLSSRMLVWGAVGIAESFGVSDLIIGLTIVALGTSLPELAASIASALKGEHDIALGNVIGSNMFNLLAVLGLPGIIQPGRFDPAVLSRDYPIMLGLTIGLFVLAYGFRKPGHVNRSAGAILLLCYAAYQLLLYFDAQTLGA